MLASFSNPMSLANCFLVVRAQAVPLAIVVAALGTSVARGDAELHQRIDRLVDTSSTPPVASGVGDAEFLRRVHLDLVGVIPPVDLVRSFLDDPSDNKRGAIVNQLVGGPHFVRHMVDVFDVMLMERRREVHVNPSEWREFLRESFAANKPLNQLLREVLSADGSDPSQRGPARFYLDREVDLHALTRDIGRIFFGRDFQCAQCHDHPLIDDYRQADYYGIYAYLSRSFLFGDKDKKKTMAEKAEGEASFSSVFDEASQTYHALPKLPLSPPLDEPQLNDEQRYQVEPAENVHPVPTFSRRAQLAEQATNRSNRAFSKNLANRLWAHMFGRGLVEPVDLWHPDNSPSYPRLLDLLADELVASNFDVRHLLREIALTHTYQRSVEMAWPDDERRQDAQRQLPGLDAEEQRLAQLADESGAAVQDWVGQLEAKTAQMAQLVDQRNKTGRQREEAGKQNKDSIAQLEQAEMDLPALQQLADTLAEAAAKARNAANQLPDEKSLAEAAQTFEQRAAQARQERLDSQQAAATARSNAEKAAGDLETARQKLARLEQEMADVRRQAVALCQRLDDERRRHHQDKAMAGQVAWRLANMRALATLDDNVETSRKQLLRRWNEQAAVASLKPLSPESLARSLMRATGAARQIRSVVEKEFDEQHNSAKDDHEKDPDNEERRKVVEEKLDRQLQKHINHFTRLFGSEPGQPQHDFHATVDQALFMSNGKLIRGWLTPNDLNLTGRLMNIDDPQELSEELYLNVLTRRPTDEESAEIAGMLERVGIDRSAVVMEATWALLTSAEFRFNH